MSLPVPRSYSPFESVCPSNACERCPVTADIVAGIGGIISGFDLSSPEGQFALDGVFAEKADLLSDSCFAILSRRLEEFKLVTQLGGNKIIQIPSEIQEVQAIRRSTVSAQMENLLMIFFHSATTQGCHITNRGIYNDSQEALSAIEEGLTRTVKKSKPRDEGVQHRKPKPRFVMVEEKPGRIEI